MCLPDDIQAKLSKLKESVELPVDFNGFDSTREPAAEEETYHRRRKTFSTGVVSIVAYLIGVPQKQFGREYQKSAFDELDGNTDARIIRALCSIRNGIMQNPGTIFTKLRQEVKNLDSIPEYIDPTLFRYLEEQKIKIITGSQIKQLTDYLILINNHISNRVTASLRLFPSWVDKEYIKDLIVMPGGSKKEKVQSAIDKMREKFNSYPFHCYINWPIEREDAFVEDPENFAEPILTGNVLLNDKKFLVLLYRIHGAEFQDYARVIDANKETKQSLTTYMQQHHNITMLVDCENSDPYKLCAVMEFLRESRDRNFSSTGAGETIAPFNTISKIILFDDYHTIDAWDILGDYVNIPIVHEEVERVLRHKSLVDMAMTAGACKEHYRHGTDAFIIVSSDSDYWGLMRAIPEASFLVLAEESKFSLETEKFYESHGIPTCLMDDFAANLNKIKEGALRHCLEKHMNHLMMMNLDDMLGDLYLELRMEMSPREKQNYRGELAKGLRLNVACNGDISVRVA